MLPNSAMELQHLGTDQPPVRACSRSERSKSNLSRPRVVAAWVAWAVAPDLVTASASSSSSSAVSSNLPAAEVPQSSPGLYGSMEGDSRIGGSSFGFRASTTTSADSSTSSLSSSEQEDSKGSSRSGIQCAAECVAPLASLADARTSPLATYARGFSEGLRKAEHQTLVAGVAVLVGVACAWNGPAIWRALFTATAAALAASVAHSEAKAWNLAPNHVSEWMMMLQAACFAALAVHSGFEGFQVLLGGALGALGAYGLGGWARVADDSAPGIALLWYETGAVAGLLLYTVWRRSLLAVLAPLLGAFLVTSGVGVVVSSIASAMSLRGKSKELVAALLPPEHAPWLDVASAILGEAASLVVAVHCSFALLSALFHSTIRSPLVSVSCLFVGMMIVGLTISAGFGCKAVLAFGKRDGDCPSWLPPAQDAWSWWPVVGGFLWAALTAATAWRQLNSLDAEEPAGFLQSVTQKLLRPESGYEVVPASSPTCGSRALENGDGLMSTMPSGLDAPPNNGKGSDPNGDFQTRMPIGSTTSRDVSFEEGGSWGVSSWLSRRVFKGQGPRITS